jgi:nucleoside-diphosphate-sugar epimerase
MIKYKNKVVQEDLKSICQSSVPWEKLKNKTVLVTGATGMLASYFSFILFYLNEQHHFGIKIILLARNPDKVEIVFGNNLENAEVLIQDVCDEITYSDNIDYILHAAGAASPYYIINDPTGIIKANTVGTMNILELARNTRNPKVVFTSTREIYGKIENKDIITETNMGTLDPLNSRSCYPESKRMAETLLKSYSDQYNIPFNALRIAHSYGPGMRTQNDGRVMADFMNDALHNRDIRLKSAGKAERAFCYITDAVGAMFLVMLNGNNEEAYNIANETEPIQILDLAKLIQDISQNSKGVLIPDDETSQKGYTNYKKVALGTSKIENLDWKPQISLKEGLMKTLESFNEK